MSDPVKLGPFLGINNKLPAEKLIVPASPGQAAGSFVRDAVNVDLTAAGTFQRRGGHALAVSLTRGSSLWADGGNGYLVDNGLIKTFDGTSVQTVVATVNPTAAVSFVTTPLGVAWTDGSTLQLIKGATSAPMATPAANPVPIVSGGTGGSLDAGEYIVAFAHVDAAGQRSPLSYFQTAVIAQNGTIHIGLVASTYATQVFVSCVGTGMYLETTIPAGATSADVALATSSGTTVSMTFEAPLPPGKWVRYYRGRLLTVVGRTIFYSLPYNYGIYHPATDFIQLDADVTLCEPTQDGVFLATDSNTWFLDGDDITKAPLKPLAPYGAIPNTAAAEPNTLNLWWFTPRGAVRTKDDNTLEMKQDEHMAFGAASTGAALFREENGLSQVLTTLASAGTTGATSASSYMSATTVN